MSRFTQAGCVAVVTGAASGFGRGLADALAARGLRVVYADLNRAEAEAAATAAGTHCESARLDVADASACCDLIDTTASRHGRLDLLVNVAGCTVVGQVQHTTADDWRRVIDVNLMGGVQSSIHAYKRMASQGGGQIVNVASLAGLVPWPLAAAYATAKAGLVNFSHTLRCEAAGLGVRVNVVCPGFLRTPFLGNAGYRGMTEGQLRRHLWLPSVSVERAVRKTLAGIDLDRATIVFPFSSRVCWWIARLFPAAAYLSTAALMRRVRREAEGTT